MGILFAPFTVVGLVVGGALFVLKLVAAVDAGIRPQWTYQVAGKQTKTFWLVVLILAALFWGFGLLGLAGLIAAIVYLVDVRPKLREIQASRRGGSSYGPYGPW